MNDRMLTARTFVTLAQTLSFTQTADALELSVPRVSRLIQSLEAELGCRLVHRTTRATTLTSEGEAFLPRVRDWLDEGDNLFAEGPVLKQLRAAASVPETLEALAEHRLLSLKNASDRWCFTGPDGSACELAVRPFFSGEFCERARAVCVGQCRYCARA